MLQRLKTVFLFKQTNIQFIIFHSQMYRVVNQKYETPDAYLILRLPSKKRNDITTKRVNRSQSNLQSVLQNINFRLSRLQQAQKRQLFRESRATQDSLLTPRKIRCRSHSKNLSCLKQKRYAAIKRNNNFVQKSRNSNTLRQDSFEENYDCHYDRRMQKENKQLRRENQILNQYFVVFDQRCKQKLSEFDDLSAQKMHKQDKVLNILTPNQSLHAYLPEKTHQKSSLATEFTDLLNSKSSYRQHTGKFNI